MERLISQAAELLRQGGVVVFPTETVYGIGANALDAKAVARIFEIKRRPRFNPLIVHVPDRAALDQVVSEVPAAAEKLIERFWPGPLTLVLPKREGVSDLVTAGLPTVGVRMPRHPMAHALLKSAGVPISAPSANRFTCLSSTQVEHAREQLGSEVDLYLDGGPCEVGVESSILTWIDGNPVLLREGGIPKELLEEITGPLAPAPVTKRPLAPGSLAKHYSPKTPLMFSDKPIVFDSKRRVGLLALRPTGSDSQFASVSYLSPDGDLRTAATRLFSELHEMETQGLDLIVARPFPSEGLGHAINDRLRRAGFNS